MAVAFDTLQFMERLRAGGFDERQAKAATDAFAHATSQELVTSTDLRAALAELKADLRREIGEVRADIVKWGTLALPAQAGLITTLVKLL